MDSDTRFSEYCDAVANAVSVRMSGLVTQVVGLLIESHGPRASVGDVCVLEKNGECIGRAEVVGFRKEITLLMPLGEVTGLSQGVRVVNTNRPLTIKLGNNLLGRVLDGLGRPIDGKDAPSAGEQRAIFSQVPNPLNRSRIEQPFETGIKAIDGFITVGKGQRMGIFAGSGVGKSVLMGMMARNCVSDVNVIALVGERGREVREFLERDLGEEGLKRSVVVVATSDQPPLIRLKASIVAATIAEYFRDRGNDVLFFIDSVTRLAMAQREVGLATGEPPATKGYTPSVFAMLPQLLERAGTSSRGTITGMFTVLVEADDMDEPIADSARSILDGHVVLSRDLARRNHYPAIDVPESISRCMPDVVSPQHMELAGNLRDYIAAYRENEDLIQIGAYASGTNPRVDAAIALNEPLTQFLRQNTKEKTDFNEIVSQLSRIRDHAAAAAPGRSRG